MLGDAILNVNRSPFIFLPHSQRPEQGKLATRTDLHQLSWRLEVGGFTRFHSHVKRPGRKLFHQIHSHHPLEELAFQLRANPNGEACYSQPFLAVKAPKKFFSSRLDH